MQQNISDWGWQISSFLRVLKKQGFLIALNKALHYIFMVSRRYFDLYGIMNSLRFKKFKIFTSCHIRQLLPKSTEIPHPVGIVIGGWANIGENVQLNQNVTVGNKNSEAPDIKDGVVICSGAIVIGGITVGENSIIGANSTVLSDIPPNSIAVGTPAEVVNKVEE
jgi:serine acetyltransferase